MNPIKHFIESQADNEFVLTALNGRELNKSTLAELAGVGYSIVHRTDLALYDTMPPRLYAYMKRIDGNVLWNNKYVEYKRNLLAIRRTQLQPRIWLKANTHKYVSWTEFRELVADSQMEFAKLFLINPAIVQHFESGKTRFLPIVIKKRLEYFGMPADNIAYLAELPVGERTLSDA